MENQFTSAGNKRLAGLQFDVLILFAPCVCVCSLQRAEDSRIYMKRREKSWVHWSAVGVLLHAAAWLLSDIRLGSISLQPSASDLIIK